MGYQKQFPPILIKSRPGGRALARFSFVLWLDWRAAKI